MESIEYDILLCVGTVIQEYELYIDNFELLELLHPDVLVKGGDYGAEEVVGHEIVHAYGGEVRVLSLVEDLSTTRIMEKIQGS